MDDWVTRDMVINDAAVGSVFILKTASYGQLLPALLIYKSEPRGVGFSQRLKDIDIVFYHDGQLKKFCVTTKARLTYMVKYEAQGWASSGGGARPGEPAG
jgi:hypothetical protein